MEKYQKQVEGLEMEPAASKAAWHLAESNAANFSKVVQVTKAKVVAA